MRHLNWLRFSRNLRALTQTLGDLLLSSPRRGIQWRRWLLSSSILFLMFPGNPVFSQCRLRKFLDASALNNESFGYSVSVSGSDIAIGGQGRGQVALYTLNGVNFFLDQIVTPLDGSGGTFGWSVSLAEDLMAVGHPFANDLGFQGGAAYIFERQDGVWVEVQKVFGSDTVAGDQFGYDISTDGQSILVSALAASYAGNSTVGAAYVFEKTGGLWLETQKLTPSMPDILDNFGLSLSLSGDAIVVGARNDDDLGNQAGAAYVFEDFGAGWVETAKLFASDGISGDAFGSSVAIDGDVILVGSPESAGTIGGVYVFELQGSLWGQTAKL